MHHYKKIFALEIYMSMTTYEWGLIVVWFESCHIIIGSAKSVNFVTVLKVGSYSFTLT